jgi:hypothetical protein
MSKLGVQLSVDDFEKYRTQMLAAQRLALDTTRAINGIQNVTFGNFAVPKNFAQLPQQARRVAAEVDAINKQTAANKRAQDILLGASSKTLADTQIREAKRASAAVIETDKKARAEIERASRSSGRGVSSGVGGVQGTLQAAGAAVGIGLFIGAAKSAIDVAVDAARANQILASSAIEAGLGFEQAAEKSNKFAKLVGLSDQDAKSPTAAILRLAGRTGRPQDADKLLGGFADLSAAFGIDPKDLQTLVGSILSGQDEGLNRLGIADPGQLYASYAKQIGKTADSLTQYEKTQAAVNAVMEKSAIFAGAAQDKQSGLEGQVNKAASAWANLTTGLSQSFATSGPVIDFIDEATRALSGLNLELANVNRQLKAGKTPEEIAKERGVTAGDYARGLLTQPFANIGFGVDLLSGKGFRESLDNFDAAVNPNRIAQREQQKLADQIRRQQGIDQKQQLAAQQQTDATKKKMSDDATRAEAEKQAQNIKDTKSKIEDADKAQKSLLTDLFQQANTTNPYVKLYTEADELIEKVRKGTLGLKDETRAMFADLAVEANRFQRFSLRLDSQLEASNLRDRAADFRNPFDQKKLTQQKQKQKRDFLAANPNYLYLKAQEYDARRQDTRDPLSYNDQSFEDFINEDMGKINPGNVFRNPQKDAQDRIDRQFKIIDSQKASTDAERAAADRKAIAIAGNDPTALRDDQRIKVAEALEREADRKIRDEDAAKEVQNKMLLAQQAVATNTAALVQLAGKGGKSAIELIFSDKDGNTSAEIKAPTQEDTQKEFTFTGFEFLGGSNR